MLNGIAKPTNFLATALTTEHCQSIAIHQIKYLLNQQSEMKYRIYANMDITDIENAMHQIIGVKNNERVR